MHTCVLLASSQVFIQVTSLVPLGQGPDPSSLLTGTPGTPATGWQTSSSASGGAFEGVVLKTLQDLSAKITSLDRLVLQQPYLLNSRRAYIEIPSCARHVQFWYFLPTVLYSKLPACKVSKMHAKKANVMLSISHPCLSYAPCHKSYCAHTHFRPAGASKARLKVDDAVLESHKAAAWTLTLRDVKSNLFWQTKSKENQGFSTNAQSLLVWFTLIYSPQVPKSPLFQTCPIWTKHPPMANAIAHALMKCSPTHDHLIMLHGCAIP